MSTTDRQNRLLLAEDWKRVYQSFRNADFQSYDFDNLRRTMINYLRQNYPEDFNDYIESSEYLALIDLIAYLGQNIAFRVDLNARENFLELAERRESVLRLARLLSYNPKRNQAANGLLKFTSLSTTENIIDSNGVNLATQTIVWNDVSNPYWYEQFVKLLNAALPANSVVGRPIKTDTVNGINVEQYRFNATNTDLPNYSFSKTINGKSSQFEVVSTDISNGDIIEEPPLPGNSLAFLFRDDGQGAASSNTGFFLHFRQGRLDNGNFSVTTPSTNQTVAIDATNVNNSDVWLYKLDSAGIESELWTKVDAVEGNNIVYNSLSKNIRSIYSVLTRVEDRISLIFSDGTFGELPKGTFKVYYRISDNRNMIINPDDMIGISIAVPYISKKGTTETLTIGLNLKYTVSNSSVSETNESIKTNAPATYYTQNRMITGEDYNVAPLSVSQEIVKVKSVNRTSSGISRYFDLLDATGKYSKTNLFGIDGILYTQYLETKAQFSFVTRTDVEGVISNIIEPIIEDTKLKNFYYSKFPRTIVTDLNASWVQTTRSLNQTTGYLQESDRPLRVGSFTGNNLRFFKAGSLVKFVAPTGYHFSDEQPEVLHLGDADAPGTSTYKWTKVIGVSGPGTDITNGKGPVIFNDIIPEGSLLDEIIPRLATTIENDVKTRIIDQVFAYKSFGLRFDVPTGLWRVIVDSDLNLTGEFNTGKTGDTTSAKQDASWLLLFQTDGEKYTITYRNQRYVFESDKEIRFYFDSSDKVYNPSTGEIVKDKITILPINRKPGSTGKVGLLPMNSGYQLEIQEEYRDREGYVDSKKIQVGFFDSDDDGVIDNPDIFEDVVTVNDKYKWIFQEQYTTTDGVEDFRYVKQSDAQIQVYANEAEVNALGLISFLDQTIFYFYETNVFKIYNEADEALSLLTNYRAYVGRDDLQFQYEHAADESNRIDPSSSNIIDVYLLSKQYDTQYRLWLEGSITQKPLPPSSDSLFSNFGSEINKIKSISDEVIYHPVKYKVLFGEKANKDLQATFKIVKNPDLVVNDNEIKARVVSAINSYFALENWDFGETFYFQELATYITNRLSPDLASIVIVPNQATQAFGSLFEIRSEADEIFVSGATVDNIEIIDAITATKLRASGDLVTSVTNTTTGVVSSSTTTVEQTNFANYAIGNNGGSSS
jgi:hypothetical protein